ncbi:MAG: hypothetical protein A2176_06775 [Spirochaetes bacterium RBG_13_51_14]|nr:MAG: hypothetical protein A2176_06775 [Spirochaetes bacterium RBG_13_51_14]
MKKPTVVCLMAFFACVCAGYTGAHAADAAADDKGHVKQTERGGGTGGVPADSDKYDSGLQNRINETHGKDSGGADDIDVERKNRAEEEDSDAEKKKYQSVRRKKDRLSFYMGFSIGAIGYGILGPRSTATELYRFKYEKESFTVGFRGGMEALLYPVKGHCLSLGFFYEQRKVQIKIADVSLMSLFLAGLPPGPGAAYFLPLERYVDKSNVDTNYFTFPVAYRFHIMDELYIGLSVDVGVLFQAKASYSILTYQSSLDLRKHLKPVDFGGRVIFGFTTNRVFIEISIGTDFLDIDRLAGERHTIHLTGMVGYRI